MDRAGLSSLQKVGAIDASLTPHFTVMGTENKVESPEVVMRFPTPTDVDAPQSVSPPPGNQFVKRIGKHLAHGSSPFQAEPRIVPWSRLSKEVDHALESRDIRTDRAVLRKNPATLSFIMPGRNFQCQVSRPPFWLFSLR